MPETEMSDTIKPVEPPDCPEAGCIYKDQACPEPTHRVEEGQG